MNKKLTKALAVLLAFALLIPGSALFASAECDHDYSVRKVITPATCDAEGLVHYFCSKCGDDEGLDYYTNTIHEDIQDDWNDHEINENAYWDYDYPTCTDWGCYGIRCSICNDWITRTTEEPLGHTEVWKIDYEPSDDHPGQKTKYCSRCGESLGESEEITMHEHECERDYGDGSSGVIILRPATCTQDGERGLICKYCNAVFATEPIEAKGHVNSMLEDYWTSTDPLKDYFGCHNVVTVLPTCTEKGTVTFLCDVCGEPIHTFDLEPNGHYNGYYDMLLSNDDDPADYLGSLNVDGKAPTCTEAGYVDFLCIDCHEVIAHFVLEAIGHSSAMLDDYLTTSDTTLEDYIGSRNVVSKLPTCTEAGYIKFLCDDCGEVVRTYELEALDHDEGTWQIDFEATPDHNGWMSLHCNRCGELLEKKEFELHEHVYGEWYKNCDGTHSHICLKCGFKDSATCKYVGTVTPPTCTEGGYTTYVCSDCGDTYVSDFTPPLGHDWSAWVDDGNGETHTRTCNRCGEKEVEDHCFCEWFYNHDAKFFKNGTKSRICDICGCTETVEAKHTAWFWHPIYPIILFLGSTTHKAIFVASLYWLFPWLNLYPEM
ncbi:MAG: hypothetical protein IJU96_03815 [Clostridia bacterium]|nr:hypothetical protein [Clostridia bacterium]